MTQVRLPPPQSPPHFGGKFVPSWNLLYSMEIAGRVGLRQPTPVTIDL